MQYVWQHQLLEGGLTTVDGQAVHVERPGDLNTDAGPDFTNARLTIGGTSWAGNVEVHVKASDWNRHRHSSDHAYDNVVLHVVYEADAEIAVAEGHKVSTLSLRRYIPDSVWNNYEALVSPPESRPIGCADRLGEVPRFAVNAYLERLAVERVERKCAVVRRLLQESRGSWEQCCYWMLAHYFGGKTNAFAFELLAKATDQRLLARWRDNALRVEALLMGQAGLLDARFEDEYPQLLQADYESIRAGARLTPISGYLWKFFRLRPYSFPTLRISQFAQLVCQSENLFSHLLETADVKVLQGYFDVAASPYWDNHFQFDTLAAGKPKRVGTDFVNTLIINAWVPLLFEYGSQHGDQKYKDQAIDLLAQLPSEKNRIITLWRQSGLAAQDAFQSQALIQLYTERCRNHGCLDCNIGYKLIKH